MCDGVGMEIYHRVLAQGYARTIRGSSKDFTAAQREMWDRLDRRADVEILQRFPRLARRPKKDFEREHRQMYRTGGGPGGEEAIEEYTPWRLWGAMVPSGIAEGMDRSLILLGFFISLQGALRAEISSLWAFAWLNGQLERRVTRLSINNKGPSALSTASIGDPTGGDIYYETALFNRFGRWRYPYGYGARLPDVAFDGLPYLIYYARIWACDIGGRAGAGSERFSGGTMGRRIIVVSWGSGCGKKRKLSPFRYLCISE